MLIFVLIHVHYSQNAVFSFYKGSNRQEQNYTSLGSHHPIKKHHSIHYFLKQNQGNSLSFRWKRTVTLYWNLVNTCKYLVNQNYWANLSNYILYCSLFFTVQHFRKLGVNFNGLVVKVLDSQSPSSVFETIRCAQGQR